MHTFLITILFSIICIGPAFSNFEKANKLYDESKKIMKEGDRSKNGLALSKLKQARDIIFNLPGELEPDQEITLSKINSNIYWLVKFGSVNDMSVGLKSKKPKKEKKKKLANINKTKRSSKSDIAWEKQKKEKQEEFNSELKKAEKFEKKHKKDSISNLINYLDLHPKAVNESDSKAILEKTAEYSDKIDKEKEMTFLDAIQKIDNYDKLLKNKDYAEIAKRLIMLLRVAKLSPKAKFYMKQVYYEINAMRYLKESLLTMKLKAIPFPDIFNGFVGAVVKIDNTGFHLMDNENKKSFVGWEVISEKNLLTLASNLIQGEGERELIVLAFANMRLEKYLDAFKHFKALIKMNNSNLMRYQDYLSKCEAGYRMQLGPIIDKTCKRAKKMAEDGNRQGGLDLIISLFERYTAADLGKIYQERILFAYNEILRM